MRVKSVRRARECSSSISFAAQFFQHRAAALADCGIGLVFANVRGVVPAAVALGPIGLLHLNVHAAGAVARSLRKRDRGNDEQIPELVADAAPAPNMLAQPR